MLPRLQILILNRILKAGPCSLVPKLRHRNGTRLATIRINGMSAFDLRRIFATLRVRIMQAATHIHVKGAREHNLKNLELRLPRGKLIVITGPSGSGKSSLAFDTIYAEGYRKYIESLSTHARQVLDQLKRPDVDFIHGLSPVLAIEQRTGAGGPRSTIATATEIADYAHLLWALLGEQYCPKDGGRVIQRSLDDNVRRVLAECAGERVVLLAPFMRARPSVLRDELPRLRQRGFQRVRIGHEVRNL